MHSVRERHNILIDQTERAKSRRVGLMAVINEARIKENNL